MKKRFVLFLLLLACLQCSYAQKNVGIGTSTPDTNAILEMKATDKGILIPRMNATQRVSMGSSMGMNQKGLLVFDNDSSKFFYWNGIMWLTIQTGPQGPPGVAQAQSYGVRGTATTVSSNFPSWTLVNGLSRTINLVDSATVNVFTNGGIDPLGIGSGFWGYVQLFINGSQATGGRQTINSITNYLSSIDVTHWSFSYPLVLPPGSYTFEIKTTKYDSGSPDYTASQDGQSSMIIQVFY
jgi:hypothetical protein